MTGTKFSIAKKEFELFKDSSLKEILTEKSFWGPKTNFSFFDFYHKISYGENDFVIQII